MSLIPQTMSVIEIKAPGGPEQLVRATRPVPVPGDGEVLIKIAAAGVNRPDLLQREGRYPPPPGASDLPGLEVAGTVIATGPEVGRWHLGDKVAALITGGGYAEYVAAPALQCLPWPAGFGAAEAAAVPETFFTVWTNVFERGALKPEESLLVHGGASGIGTTAIQIASALGARVLTTVGDPAKTDRLRALGAEVVIDYKTQDFVAETLAATGGRGVDVILDMVGGPYVAGNLKALARDGRLVNIAFLEGSKVEIDLLPIMLKRLTLTGSTLRARAVAEKGAIAAALETQVWPLLSAGTIRPVIDETFPLGQAAAAHAKLESRRHLGKVVLIP